MNLIAIIVLMVVLVLTLFLVTLLLALFQKHRRLVLKNFSKDLTKYYQRVQVKKMAKNQLPINSDEIKEDIYFYTRSVIGNYLNFQRIINEKNWNVSENLKNSKIKIFYHYKIINLGSSKFIPLNKIDILISLKHLYLFHPIDGKIVNLKNIENITVFWEKNSLVQQKDFFPGLAFTAQKENYFLLFETYQDVLEFLAYLNLLI